MGNVFCGSESKCKINENGLADLEKGISSSKNYNIKSKFEERNGESESKYISNEARDDLEHIFMD